jgi:hypothetical protein
MSSSAYTRLDSFPTDQRSPYIICELDQQQMKKSAIKQRAELNERLLKGQNALIAREYKKAVHEFQYVLRQFPNHQLAWQALEMARDKIATELSQEHPVAHSIFLANQALDQVASEYSNRIHSKEALGNFQKRLLDISNIYASCFHSDPYCPVPKIPQLNKIYKKVSAQLQKHIQKDLVVNMERRLISLQSFSLKNERHLDSILVHCAAWNQDYEEGGFSLGSDQMYNKTQIDQILDCANTAKTRLERMGLFFVETINQTILQVKSRWKMEPKNREDLTIFYTVVFMNNQALKNRFISLTPKGMKLLEHFISDHMKEQIKKQGRFWFFPCLFMSKVQRRLSDEPPFEEEDIERWIDQIQRIEPVEDISDRLKMIRRNDEAGQQDTVRTV